MQDGWFPEFVQAPVPRPKRAKLGRYERLQRALAREGNDPRRVYVEVSPGITVPPGEPLTFNFVDLFCGAGGITQGFRQAGLRPVASVEGSEVASATHERNFPGCHHFRGRIEDFQPLPWLEAAGRPEVHVVSGGPPCQGFSVAGMRDPDDSRNGLFREFVRVVATLRPWFIVMENVPGILTLQRGRVREAIVEAFAGAGYPDASVLILESAAYGVPQIRPRAIFVANRLGLDNPFPRPRFEPAGYRPIESALHGLPDYEPLPAINHEWTRHSPAFMARIAKVPPGGSLYPSFFDAFKRQYPGVPSMTVKENHGGTHIHPRLDRVISAREMARLQTFPDDFIFSGSMKKAMWQIGNAVPPLLAECIARALLPSLERARGMVGGSPRESHAAV